jgi:hypothetical protein
MDSINGLLVKRLARDARGVLQFVGSKDGL